jgi:hypothetical protein
MRVVSVEFVCGFKLGRGGSNRTHDEVQRGARTRDEFASFCFYLFASLLPVARPSLWVIVACVVAFMFLGTFDCLFGVLAFDFGFGPTGGALGCRPRRVLEACNGHK